MRHSGLAVFKLISVILVKRMPQLRSSHMDVLSGLIDEIERFSNECRKTKTKAITLTNPNRNKTQNEPIRNQIKYKQLALSAGKRVRARHDWFWFTPDWLRKWREFF